MFKIKFLVILFFFVTQTAFAQVTFNLIVQNGEDEIYNDSLTVESCDETENISAYCALTQAPFETTWNTFGDDLFLESVDGIINDFVNNLYWGYFINRTYGETALNTYMLSEGEELLLAYNTSPLIIELTDEFVTLGESTEISVQSFGFDESWQPVWENESAGSIFINDEEYLTENGVLNYTPSTIGEFTVYGTALGFVDSGNHTLTVVSGTSSDEEPIEEIKEFDVPLALNFLSTLQENDGSFGSSLYTDWISLAFAKEPSFEDLKDKLKSYLLNNIPSFERITDYERHAMALMAFGIDPYTGTSINYIEEIVNSFDGTQLGNPDQINDDIFGLLVLSQSGYDENDEIIQKITDYILEKQSKNGSWESIDMTSASVQALNNISPTLSKTKEYFESLDDFGNEFSTSWALQALHIFNMEDQINSSVQYLGSKQGEDGGIEGSSESNRMWATAYAIPAVSGLTWKDIMDDFDKYEEEVIVENTSNSNGGSKNDNSDGEVVESTIVVVENIVKEIAVNTENDETHTVEEITNISQNIEPEIIESVNNIEESNDTPRLTASPYYGYRVSNEVTIILISTLLSIMLSIFVYIKSPNGGGF